MGLEKTPWKPTFLPLGASRHPTTPSQATCAREVSLPHCLSSFSEEHEAGTSSSSVESLASLAVRTRMGLPREMVLVPGLSPNPSLPTRLWPHERSHIQVRPPANSCPLATARTGNTVHPRRTDLRRGPRTWRMFQKGGCGLIPWEGGTGARIPLVCIERQCLLSIIVLLTEDGVPDPKLDIRERRSVKYQSGLF